MANNKGRRPPLLPMVNRILVLLAFIGLAALLLVIVFLRFAGTGEAVAGEEVLTLGGTMKVFVIFIPNFADRMGSPFGNL